VKNRGFLGVVITMIFAACASQNPPTGSQPVCITPEAIKSRVESTTGVVKKMMSQFVEKDQKLPDRLELVERTCTKWTYNYLGTKVIFYKNPAAPVTEIEGEFRNTGEDKTAKLPFDQCRSRVLEDYKTIGADFALRLLEKDAVKTPWKANDPDLGPFHFVKCNVQRDFDYWISLDTLAHETSHDLEDKHCILLAYEQTPACLSFPAPLPKPTVAMIKKMPTTHKKWAQTYEAIQHMYVADLEDSLQTILDELNSYTVSTRINTLAFKAHPRELWKAPFVQNLPLFQTVIARYLTELQKSNPVAYKSIMNDSVTQTSLKKLLAAGERAWSEWKSAIQAQGHKPTDLETNVWQEYQQLKPKIFPLEFPDKFGYSPAQ